MNIELLKEIRGRTGAGILDCKKVLEETHDDIEKAIEILRRKGIAKAEKKMSRETKEGAIGAYIHPGARLGVLVEINCETDFVARTDEFKKFVKDIAMQIAATDPIAIARESIPQDVIDRELSIYKDQVSTTNKPENVLEKIVESKMEKFYKDVVLLEQPFIKDNSITVMEYLKEHISKFGENITIRKFARFKLGE